MGYEVLLTPDEMRTMYRRMIIAGLEPIEAGNVVAVAIGLKPTKNGWKVQEIINMIFIDNIKHTLLP